MIELTPLEFGVCLGLTAATFAFAAYWYMRFFRVLRLDRKARRAAGEAREVRDFATEVMDLGVAGSTSQAINEFGRRVLEALHKRVPGTQLWWISRHPGAGGPMVSRRGGTGVSSTSLAPALFEDATRDEGFFDLTNGLAHGRQALEGSGQGPAVPAGGADSSPLAGGGAFRENSFLKHLGSTGLRRVRVVLWGRPDATNGVLAVGAAGGDVLESSAPFVEIVKSHATALASIIDELARISKTRERLEGGLSSTIEDLTSTHMRLIEKTRKIKALEDVAGAIATHGGQAQPALSAIVSIIARFLEADLVAVLLLDEDTGELVVHPGSYGLEGGDMFYRVALTEDRSSSVRVLKTGKPYVSGDAQNDPAILSANTRLMGISSLMVVPLTVEGRSLGIIRVGKRGRNAFGAEDLQGLQVIAEEAAVIVETAMLNKRLAAAAEQLIALNRMKDDFVSTVSHEFKTPLTTILGFITVVLEGEAGDVSEQAGRFLGIARTAARRLTGLVSDLLDLSKLEGGIRMDLRTIELDRLLAASVEAYSHQFSNGDKTLSVDIPADLPKVTGDERWVGLAVDNLLSNALKFTKPGGRVRLSAQDKGEFIMVSVADNGIGIPPEERERVFDKFYRASNRGEVQAPGTGLGLAIVKEVVSKHGGKIWLEAETQGETKFCFVLKRAPSAPTA